MSSSAPGINPAKHHEQIDTNAWIAPGVVIRGDVTIQEESSVWFGAVIRGDTEAVQIGRRTNIQDTCVIHADPGFPCQIGNEVTMGHGAIAHGALIGDRAMIGIRAVVLNGAEIGEGALVAAGALVKEGQKIPAGKLAVGVPARVIADVSNEQTERIRMSAVHYVSAATAYRNVER